MGDSEIAHFELDVALGVEPISGQLRTADAPPRRFAGVLELMTLLDQARAGGQDDGGGDSR
jgi:hypothetical protein